ncbi:MAG: rhomboid family intramembrane serine protease [Odoribacter sp.]
MQSYRPFSGITPAVKMLLILNVVMYFLAMFLDRNFHIDTADMLGLHLPQSFFWNPWQYVTHMFMHGSISHLFFNMFALFMFGRILESVWGSRRFLIFYFVCGIGAGTLNSLIGWFEVHRLLEQYQAFKSAPSPELLSEFVKNQVANPASWVWEVIDSWINQPNSQEYIQAGEVLFQRIIDAKINVPMIGASGAIFGILLAFGMLFPNTELYLMFIPIPIKAKYFVLGYGLIELFLGFQNSASDNVAHFAHLGGMLFGYILLKYWGRKSKKFY